MNLRRKDREVTEIKELMHIIDQCKVCRLGMRDNAGLYIVPMNFGYAYDNNQLVLFFHSAKAGRTIKALKENIDIYFEMDCEHHLITGDIACQYSYSYKSIIGNGKVVFIDEIEEKKTALSTLMKHQTGKKFSFDDRMANSVLVFKVIVHKFTGKCHS